MIEKQTVHALVELIEGTVEFLKDGDDLIVEMRSVISELKIQLDNCNNRNSALHAALIDRNKKLGDLRMDFFDRGYAIESLRSQLADRKEHIANLQEASEGLHLQIADLWTQLAERDGTIAGLVERVNKCTDDFGNVTG